MLIQLYLKFCQSTYFSFFSWPEVRMVLRAGLCLVLCPLAPLISENMPIPSQCSWVVLCGISMASNGVSFSLWCTFNLSGIEHVALAWKLHPLGLSFQLSVDCQLVHRTWKHYQACPCIAASQGTRRNCSHVCFWGFISYARFFDWASARAGLQLGFVFYLYTVISCVCIHVVEMVFILSANVYLPILNQT